VVNEVTLFLVRREGSALPISCRSFASLLASPPPPPPDDDDDDGGEPPSPSPTPTPARVPTVIPEAPSPAEGAPGAGPAEEASVEPPPLLPVKLLPETGTREAETGHPGAERPWGLVCLGLGALLYLYGQRRRRFR
jgi:hypothetical protein